jgi:hypothetical protein
MRDARQISSREVSHGVQRHVLAQTTWFRSTVRAHSRAAPQVFRAPGPVPRSSRHSGGVFSPGEG